MTQVRYLGIYSDSISTIIVTKLKLSIGNLSIIFLLQLFSRKSQYFRKSIDDKLQSFNKIMKILKTYLVNPQSQTQMTILHSLPMLSIMLTIMTGQVVLAQVRNLMNPILFLMHKKNSLMKVTLSRMSLKILTSMTSLEKTLLLENLTYWNNCFIF